MILEKTAQLKGYGIKRVIPGNHSVTNMQDRYVIMV